MTKYLIPLVVVYLLGTLSGALIRAEGYGARSTAELEPAVQFTETGKEYKHGSWCIDGRVF